MHLPDYSDNSIVNLMASISKALGGPDKGYGELAWLPADELVSRNIVLLVIDGLGYDFLARHPDSCLHEHQRAQISSVFPTTTASAVTSFLTGVAPQQHAITGWFTWFRELGSVAAVLPFVPRFGGACYTQSGVQPRDLFDQSSIFDGLNATSYVLNPSFITDSVYSNATSGSAKRIPHSGMDDYFAQIKTIVRKNSSERSFTYAYWSELDARCHHSGVNSQEVEQHFQQIDAGVKELLESLAGTNTTVIISADHGLLDTTEERTIRVNDHPHLQACLTMPLCGEPRAAYAYVRAHKAASFEAYVQNELADACTLYPSDELIERGFFGQGEPHPRLHERIGDYTLIMKENYVMVERLVNEKPFHMIGVHGGISGDELYVPLCVVHL